MNTSETAYVDGLLEPDLKVDRKCNVERICEALKLIRNNKIPNNVKGKDYSKNGIEEKLNEK